MAGLRVYTVGWPHSGNKHLGRLLAYALGVELPRFALPRSRGGGVADAACPTVCQSHCLAWHEPRERLINQTGQPVISRKRTLAYMSLHNDERLVWIVRDPRDAAVSAWMSGLGSDTYAPDYTLLSYLAERFTTAGNPCGPRCSWREHAGGWLEAAGRDGRIACTSHEALYADRAGELRRVLRALGLPEDGRRIRDVAGWETGRTRPAYDGSGVRVKIGCSEWRAHFGTREAWLLECHCGDLMRRLGYGKELRWQALTERV